MQFFATMFFATMDAGKIAADADVREVVANKISAITYIAAV